MQKNLFLGMLFLQTALLHPLSAMTITSGTWSMSPTTGVGNLTVSGPGFSLKDVSLDLVAASLDGILTVGVAYSPNHIIFGNGSRTRASATINGITTADDGMGIIWGFDAGDRALARHSFLTVTGTPVVLPPEGGVVFGTFQLTGSLCGVRGSTPYVRGVPLPCEIDVPILTGSGSYSVATVGDRQNPTSAGYYNIARPIVFTFADPTADIPEPATWAMLAFGLAGMSLLRKRKTS